MKYKNYIFALLPALFLYLLFAILNGFDSMSWGDGWKAAYASVVSLATIYAVIGIAMHDEGTK